MSLVTKWLQKTKVKCTVNINIFSDHVRQK